MKTYDVIVVGSGSGGEIVDAAVSHGMTVAWADKGPSPLWGRGSG